MINFRYPGSHKQGLYPLSCVIALGQYFSNLSLIEKTIIKMLCVLLVLLRVKPGPQACCAGALPGTVSPLLVNSKKIQKYLFYV